MYWTSGLVSTGQVD